MEEQEPLGLQALAERARDRFAREWPAVPQSVSEARRAIGEHARALGATPAALSAIQLAVSEAVTNAIQHAYAAVSVPGRILVTAEPVGAASVCVIVADEGQGMRPRPDSPGLGLGLPLIAQLTQGFDVHLGEGGRGTELRMRFDLHRGVL
jgi:anti-sigma regulatory factor (Ser/Thr protein kinase)